MKSDTSQQSEWARNRRKVQLLIVVAIIAVAYHVNRHFNSGIEDWSEAERSLVQKAIMEEQALAAKGTGKKKTQAQAAPTATPKPTVQLRDENFIATLSDTNVAGSISLRVLAGELTRLEMKVGRDHLLKFSDEEIVLESGAKYWIDRITLTHIFQPALKLDKLVVVKSKARIGSLDSRSRSVRFVADVEISTSFEDGKIIGDIVIWRGVEKDSKKPILEYLEGDNPKIYQRYHFTALREAVVKAEKARKAAEAKKKAAAEKGEEAANQEGEEAAAEKGEEAATELEESSAITESK